MHSSAGSRERVLLTGGTGFVGQAVQLHLGNLGIATTTLTRRPDSQAPRHLCLGEGRWSTEAIAEAIAEARPSAIIHLAGASRAPTIDQLYETNVLLAERLMTAAQLAAPAAAVLLLGSAAEYGVVKENGVADETDPCLPVSAYGITKLAQTLHGLARARSGQPVVIARLFNPVGVGMPLGLAFADFAQRLVSSGRLEVGNIDVKRDFFPVREAARIICELAFKPEATGQVVNVCSGSAQPLRSGADHLVRCFGRSAEIVSNPQLFRANDVGIICGGTGRLKSLGIRPASPEILQELEQMMEALLDD